MALLDDGYPDQIEIRIPCRAEYVRTVRRTLGDFAESVDMPEPAIEEIQIAASEAVANVIRHAYAKSGKKPYVRIKCAKGRGGLTVEVIDRGAGFAAPPDGVVPAVDLDREGGIGIILMKGLMDRVRFVSKPDTGTRIKMTKRARAEVDEITRKTAR